MLSSLHESKVPLRTDCHWPVLYNLLLQVFWLVMTTECPVLELRRTVWL